MGENDVAKHIVNAANHIHVNLGPGLLESAYQAVLVRELQKRGLQVEEQVLIPLRYEGVVLGPAYRADLIVEDLVIVEVKSVDELPPAAACQLLTYLKMADKRLGLLINFNKATIKEGIKRIVRNLPEQNEKS